MKQLYGLEEAELMMLLGMKKKLEDDTMAEGMNKLAEEMKKLEEEMKKIEDDNIPEDTKTEKTTVIFL